VTWRSGLAHEETIEAELFAAEVKAIRNPGGIEGRPGWLEGICGDSAMGVGRFLSSAARCAVDERRLRVRRVWLLPV
jgi:hypothetical protein